MTRVRHQIWLAYLPCKKSLPRLTTFGHHQNVHTVQAQHDHPIAAQPTFNIRPGRAMPALSLLPLRDLFRSYVITTLSSYPLLVKPTLKILSTLAHSSSPFLSPDRNPLLHIILKKTFYAQFCAGETTREVKETAQGLKNMGFKGVILAYGKEIVLEQGEKLDDAITRSGMNQGKSLEDEAAKEDVQAWKEGTLQTVSMTSPGDFIALKFSGAGRDAMRQLAANLPPRKAVEEATVEICNLSKARGVKLLFDAEQDVVQRGINAWTMDFQRRYNDRGKAVVYGTYQAYLRSAPETLAKHLAVAEKEGFVLGVKLVRGAYIASDPRQLFWGKKEETDNVYDGIAEALTRRHWNGILRPVDASVSAFPEVSLVLASHNQDSVRKVITLRAEQTRKGVPNIDTSYGQLMGMADEVSCDLVLACNENKSLAVQGRGEDDGPRAYKYLVWGSVNECLKYLVRRAEENRDAVTRAKDSRMALRAELARRLWRM
ncbi:MAG: hypothetical protein Q9217_003609 [Psora testacea]